MPKYLLTTHKLKEKEEKAEQLRNMASLHIVFERGAPLTLRFSQVSLTLQSRNVLYNGTIMAFLFIFLFLPLGK